MAVDAVQSLKLDKTTTGSPTLGLGQERSGENGPSLIGLVTRYVMRAPVFFRQVPLVILQDRGH